MKKNICFSRRRFLNALPLLSAAPLFLPASVLGRDGPAPNSKLGFANIGAGNRARHILSHFMQFKQLEMRAVADCRADRLQSGRQLVDDYYGNKECDAHSDFREVLARDDIDAVFIATGNRWHGLASILAAKAGKDIYSEKPVSLTVGEGRQLVDVTRRLGTSYQAGHQRRSVNSYRFVVEAVRKGWIGKLHTMLAQVWEGPVIPHQAPSPVPSGFDYDTWLGQAPFRPFTWAHVNAWQYFWDTAEGIISDMGCHYTDIMQMALDTDATGPVHFEGTAEFPKDAYSETPIRGEVRFRYANSVKGVLRQAGGFTDRFLRFIGDEGWIQIDDETDLITAEPASILKQRNFVSTSWADTGSHIGNFLESIRTRRPTIAHPESAHRAMSICQIANICLRLGRPLEWDPADERFPNDAEANRFLARAARPPWHA